ncbi:MAG TPA: RNase adapter RapZ [Clostridiales bacterium]|nr:RNase adapter RapZ [Clostridiales bacterium]
MEFLVITGMSGAGKSLVAKYMEDLGYFCVDNLPPALIPKFAEIISQNNGKVQKIALVIDVRGGELLNDIFPGLNALKQLGFTYKILFLEASNMVLVKRYKESRRSHPLAPSGRLIDGINEERKVLQKIRDNADHVMDTSNLLPSQLKEEMHNMFFEGREFKGIIINIISFGFKYGVPIECDLVFDVRFIPNPFYVKALKKLSGKNEAVRDFVIGNELTKIFLDKINNLLDFLIPNYIKEGKSQLIIGIGCTGGRHRSVAIAESIYRYLVEKQNSVIIDHRDIDKDNR